MKGRLPKVSANVELVVGYFDATLPGFVAEMTENVRLFHIDSDVYSSAATVFSELESRIVAGTIIVFDEYWNYYGWEQNEHKAFMEFVARTGRTFEYIGFASGHLSVAVKITG